MANNGEDPEARARRLQLQAAIVHKLLPFLPAPEEVMEQQEFHSIIRSHVVRSEATGVAWTTRLGESLGALATSFLESSTNLVRQFVVPDTGEIATATSRLGFTQNLDGVILICSWSEEELVVEWQCQGAIPYPELLVFTAPEDGSPLALVTVAPVSADRVELTREDLGFTPTTQPWVVAFLRMR